MASVLMLCSIYGLTVKFANSLPCACRGSSGQKRQYDLMTLAYQHFAAVLLLISRSLFLSGIHYSECSLVCHHENVRTNIKFLVKLGKSGRKIRKNINASLQE
jgi:hypothetical protein